MSQQHHKGFCSEIFKVSLKQALVPACWTLSRLCTIKQSKKQPDGRVSEPGNHQSGSEPGGGQPDTIRNVSHFLKLSQLKTSELL